MRPRFRVAAASAGALMIFVTSVFAQTAASLPPDVAFGRQIAFIRAHIATGDEFMQKRDWALAHRHFMFPVEEVYGAIRLELAAYKTRPFDATLKALARTVEARNAKQYPHALDKVQASLAAADGALKARQSDWPAFTVRVAAAVLEAAPDEYDDAVEGGRIVRPISYQVARSYILEADRMIEAVAGGLATKRPDVVQAIRDDLSQLKQTFSALNAPKEPPQDLAAVMARISAIKAAAAKL